MRQVAMIVIGGLLLAGCPPGPSTQDVYRCHEGIELNQLVESAGVPMQRKGWSIGGSGRAIANRIFDSQSETVLTLSDSTDFVNRMCRQLQGQLASRCAVPEFWSATDYCVATTETRFDDITDSKGFYTLRPSKGRVALFATSLPNGRTELILTHTEWAN